MDYKELYERAIDGDFYAVQELNEYANKDKADAQYMLYCIYSDVTSPFRDTSLAMQWLKMSAENGYAEAQIVYNKLPSDQRIKYEIEKNDDYEAKFDASKEIKDGGIMSFYGRISRKKFVVTILPLLCLWGCINYYLLNIVQNSYNYLDSISFAIEEAEKTNFPISLFAHLIGIILLYLFFCQLTKRAHDCGHTCLFPIVAIILSLFGSVPLLISLIFYSIIKGEAHLNQYGPIPQ